MLQAVIDRIAGHDGINFVLTNRIPRKLATRAAGWFSRIEHPLVANLSIRAFQLFAGDLRLHEARQSRFRCLHDCFIRELAPGARHVDSTPGVLVSPSDGIVVGCGTIAGTTLIQAKGRSYTLEELLDDPALVDRHRNGSYVTLRLTAAMYHRFHAPCDGEVEGVRFIPGDTWNVNPATLARVDRVYCRNTRAIVPVRVAGSSEAITLVAVGAILVASVELTFLPGTLAATPAVARRIACRASLGRGDEMGYFRHGSTIVILATPGLTLIEGITEGVLVRMGQPMWHERLAPA